MRLGAVTAGEPEAKGGGEAPGDEMATAASATIFKAWIGSDDMWNFESQSAKGL